jgi:hypothetical protein
MSGHHTHCNDGHDHGHAHDDPDGTAGPSDSLYSVVDTDGIVLLNSSGRGQDLFRPWDKRMDDVRVESDDGPEMLVL